MTDSYLGGDPGKKKATTDNHKPIMDIGVKYEVVIEETNFLQRYVAYVSMFGVRYSSGKQYEKKFVGKTVEEVEQQAKAYIDQKRQPPPEPECVKKFYY